MFVGAGISVSSGVPDFRSSGGLYDLVKEKYPKIPAGKDMFHISMLNNIDSSRIFNEFITQLKLIADKCTVSLTHVWIKHLYDRGQLKRLYTQNIDMLEHKLDLKENYIVSLHGGLEFTMCTKCSTKESYDHAINDYLSGNQHLCQSCTNFNKSKELNTSGKKTRITPPGVMYPNIILYGQTHPQGESIGEIISEDIKKKHDLVIVIGTSLKVDGLNRNLKDMIASVKKNGGKSIYIDIVPLKAMQWVNVFDYQLIGDCDKWAKFLDPLVLKYEHLMQKLMILLADKKVFPSISINQFRKTFNNLNRPGIEITKMLFESFKTKGIIREEKNKFYLI